MSTQIIQSIISTTYLVFIIIFLWMWRLRPGVFFWAMALLCALVSRLAFPIVESFDDEWLILIFYSLLNIFEKPLLVAGFYRFFELDKSSRWFWNIAFSIIVLIMCCYSLQLPIAPIRAIFIFYNVFALLYIGMLIHQNYHHVDSSTLKWTAYIFFIFGFHWLSYYPIVYFNPEYAGPAFIFGTVLNITIYISLILTLLLSVQHKLELSENLALSYVYLDENTEFKNKRYLDNLICDIENFKSNQSDILAFIYINLDSLKAICESEGNRISDNILIQTANRLTSNTSKSDLCIRMNEDEFLVITNKMDYESDSIPIGESLLKLVNQSIWIGKKSYKLDASVGISIYPKDGVTVETLIDRSSKAMNEVKRTGKNRVMRFDRLLTI